MYLERAPVSVLGCELAGLGLPHIELHEVAHCVRRLAKTQRRTAIAWLLLHKASGSAECEPIAGAIKRRRAGGDSKQQSRVEGRHTHSPRTSKLRCVSDLVYWHFQVCFLHFSTCCCPAAAAALTLTLTLTLTFSSISTIFILSLLSERPSTSAETVPAGEDNSSVACS